MVYDVYHPGNAARAGPGSARVVWRFPRQRRLFPVVNVPRRIASRIDTPSDKRRYVRSLFTGIAGRYDAMNDVMSLGLHRRWKRRTLRLAGIAPGQRVLDLAAGTGDLARGALEMSGADLEVVAADLTPQMMRVGREREGPALLAWLATDAEALPFPDGVFDRILIGYGLRNFARLDVCLKEILRCLRPGGRLASLDFGKPRSAPIRAGYLAWLDISTRIVGRVLHGDVESYVYIPESLRRFPDQEEVRRLMEDAGFVGCGVEELLLGTMAIHYGERPRD